uniref:Nucleolar protein 58 n=1 Tax=Oryza barthii TaxID=65489 RepID=A0A0D3FIG8_9ORYZ
MGRQVSPAPSYKNSPQAQALKPSRRRHPLSRRIPQHLALNPRGGGGGGGAYSPSPPSRRSRTFASRSPPPIVDSRPIEPRCSRAVREMLVLFETPAGFALFKVLDEGKLDKVEDLWKEFTTSDSARKVVELKAFNKFENTSDALSAATLIIDSKPTKGLRKFLQKHCEGETLAVADSKLGNAIKEKLKIDCLHNSAVMELMRGLRNQLTELISGLGAQDLGPMSLGLSHSLSRYKLKFSPEKVDTMIIQAIGLLDDLDKELNTYAMRVREWYGWHFPELTKIVADNIQYAKVVKMMGDRTNAESLDFSEILSDDEVEAQLKEVAVISMGTEVSELDLLNIRELCDQVLALSEYRAQLFDYLRSRMNTIAPNLTALVGELVGARLIAHGGSLVNLAKQPGSTIQILGAEKALFRALKTKHATPKYGLIYHASLIGQAAPKHKGKISRSLAAKTALAIRYDALGDGEDNSIGLESRVKLETRLRVLEGKELGRSAGSTKGKPKIEVYEKDRKKGAGALITPAKTYNPAADLVLGQSTEETPKKPEGASKKRKHQDTEPAPAEKTTKEDGDQEGEKKKKKKKSKESEESPAADADGGKKKKKKSKESEEPPVATTEGEKKEKKKKKKSDSQDAVDVAMETEESGKKEKKKKKKKHSDE